MTTLHKAVEDYLKSLHTNFVGRAFDLNQDSSLEKAIEHYSNVYLKIREYYLYSEPTQDAIEGARSFNASTNTYIASARGDKVVITVSPERAKVWGKKIGRVDE